MLKTPAKALRKAAATPKSSVKKSLKAETPKSAKKTPAKATPKSAKKATPKATPKSTKKSNVTFNASATGTPNLNQTAFDFDSIKTPNVPLETFVSPLDSSAKKPRTPQAETPDNKAMK